MKILFTICARAGSCGFRNKNLKKMNGVPLAYYALSVIRLFADSHPQHFVRTACNTDSRQLKELMQRQSMITDIRFVERRQELAQALSPKADVIKDTYLALRAEGGFDVVIDLDLTSPMRRVLDLENILTEYLADADCDLVYSVVKAGRNPYFNMVEKKKDGYYARVCGSCYTARQQAPDVYEMNASIYAYRPSFLESEIDRPITDYKCRIVQMPDYLVPDIDSEEDFRMMEYLHSFYCKREEGLRVVYQNAWNENEKTGGL